MCYLDFVVRITSYVQTLILDLVSPPMRCTSEDHLRPSPTFTNPLLLGILKKENIQIELYFEGMLYLRNRKILQAV